MTTKWGVREQNKNGTKFYPSEAGARDAASQWTRDTGVVTIVTRWDESGDRNISLVTTYLLHLETGELAEKEPGGKGPY